MSVLKTKNFFYRNSLSLTFLFLFLAAIFAQAFSGWKEYNKERTEENAPIVSFESYLRSGHFISATFENFESEFLQMALYVLLTIGLRQMGSAESKSLYQKEEVDREPKPSPNAPWPVRKGGWILKFYSSSLSIVFAILFLVSWSMHLYGSWQDQNAENVIKHRPLVNIRDFLTEPRFWFETFQNWQSEFLSIYLRQKGSPESKPVDAPNMETGQ